jgi:galactokinase
MRAGFEREFGGLPAAVAAAPGRVNLIGEHTDYSGGWVLPTALSLELRVALRFRRDARVRGASRESGVAEADLDAPRTGSWLDYPRGVARILAEAGRVPRRGFELLVESDLPPGAGLSSSAALEVATGLALAAAAGARFRPTERVELAKLCQRAESEFVGMPCGILDPFAIACGEPGAATLLRCHDLESSAVPLPFEIAVFDTGARRELREGGYAERTRECQAGLEASRRALGRELENLAVLTPADLPVLEAALDPLLLKRVRHVVGENARVHAFARALGTRDARAAGEAMYASHVSLRDDFEASWPEADFIVERARDTQGVIGARMTGAGWGGCTVQLLDGADLAALERAFARAFGRELRIWRARSSAGARLVDQPFVESD